MVWANLRHTPRIGNSHEGWEILVFTAQCITNPRSHAGKTIEGEAGAHLIFGRTVRVRVGRHRMDETHFVRQGSEVRKHFGNHLSGLSPRPEFPQRLSEGAIRALEGDQLFTPGEGLAVALDELGLVIPNVKMTERARTKDYEHILCAGGEMRGSWGIGALRRPIRTNGCSVRPKQALLPE